jgi:DNA-binding transcriptional LysR family regulator
MEIRHLKYFLAVAEELSFTEAAKSLHMSVPPLSRSIRALEKELDVQLFDRSTRHVALTPAGKMLVPSDGMKF